MKKLVFERPPSSAAARQSVKDLFAQALLSKESQVRRFAALYIMRVALRLAPHGIKSLLAVQAWKEVHMLSNKKDPEAMILHAQLLEQSPPSTQWEQMIQQADQLFEEAIAILDKKGWTRAAADQLVVDAGDALAAYGSFKINSDDSKGREDGFTALTRAVKIYGNFEACVHLESTLEENNEQHYDCLLRLAITGHSQSAKKLGDMCSLDEETFNKLSPAIRDDIKFSDVSPSDILAASQCPPYNREIDHTEKRRLEAWYNVHLKTPDDSSNAGSQWVEGASSDSSTIKNRLTTFYDTLEPAKSPATYDIRFFRALEWYKFASIAGYVPAMASGITLACRMEMPWEVCWYHEQLFPGPPGAQEQYPAEYAMVKNVPRIKDLKAFINHSVDEKSPVNLKRLMLYGNV
jgi:hypothetical protein